MNADLSNAIAQCSDRELAEILTFKHGDYTDDAIVAARAEFEKRNLQLGALLTEEDIKAGEEARKPLEKTGRKLDLSLKVLVFLSTVIIAVSWLLICDEVLYAPPFRLLGIPGAALVQFLIYRSLKQEGYKAMAPEFAVWCLNSWIFTAGIAVLFYALDFLIRHR